MKLSKKSSIILSGMLLIVGYLSFKGAFLLIEENRTESLIELDKKIMDKRALSKGDFERSGAHELVFINSVLKGEPKWAELDSGDDISDELMILKSYRKCLDSADKKSCDYVKSNDFEGSFAERVKLIIRIGLPQTGIDNPFEKRI